VQVARNSVVTSATTSAAASASVDDATSGNRHRRSPRAGSGPARLRVFGRHFDHRTTSQDQVERCNPHSDHRATIRDAITLPLAVGGAARGRWAGATVRQVGSGRKAM
jgi:hypothetical protein